MLTSSAASAPPSFLRCRHWLALRPVDGRDEEIASLRTSRVEAGIAGACAHGNRWVAGRAANQIKRHANYRDHTQRHCGWLGGDHRRRLLVDADLRSLGVGNARQRNKRNKRNKNCLHAITSIFFSYGKTTSTSSSVLMPRSSIKLRLMSHTLPVSSCGPQSAGKARIAMPVFTPRTIATKS